MEEEKPKHPGGRPPKFESVEQLETLIEQYFEWCRGHVVIKKNLLYEDQLKQYNEELEKRELLSFSDKDKHPKPTEPKEEYKVIEGEPYTITGLALYLGTTRETLCDYENKLEFSDTVKIAKLRCENGYEQRLSGNNPTGAIFALKNFGWNDKTQVDSTINANMNVNLKDASDDELIAMLK